MEQEETGRNELKKLKETDPNNKSLDELLNLTKTEYLNQIFND
jgi:hypothetical protein